MGKTHDDDEVEIDLRELFYALKKHILIVLAALLAGAVIAGAATKIFITPVYSATSTMLVLTKETTLSSLADLQIGSQLTKDYNILITSRTVLQDVVDELNLEMSYKELKECITVDNPTDTRILSITATNTDPEMAKKIADTLAKTSADFIGDKMEVTPPKIIEEGEVPTVQTSPSTKKNVMIGALAGLVLSAGIIILLTLMDDTIKSEDDIEKYLGLTTLASIPDRKDFITGKRPRNSRKTTKTKKSRRRKK
nr:Wzz/FepE/Etk N-terminal domain-containing protein [uncultured Mediterraneibacter sp.]